MKKTKATILAFTLVVTILIVGSARTASACTRADFEKVMEAAQQTILIQQDGTIEPETAFIQRNGDTYVFTDNIYASLVVDKADVVIDGAGYTLQGPYNGTQTDLWIIGEGTNETQTDTSRVPWTVGIDVRANTQNLTIKNLNIKNFTIAIWLWTQNNTITANAITENLVGILLSGISNTVTSNLIANNRDGIFFGANQPEEIPTNITLSKNGFIDNHRHLSGCVCEDFNKTEATHTWDNGSEGNFWSDYAGYDSNQDGKGDAPYVIDALNQDRYPLTANVAVTPTVAPKTPTELIIVIAVLVAIAAVAIVGRAKKPH